MRKPIIWILLVFNFYLFIPLGCHTSHSKNNTSPTIDSLYQAMMTVHDEVMPQIGRMVELQDNLRQGTFIDTLLRAQLLHDLAEAEESMWQWMHNLKQINTIPDSLNAFLYYSVQMDSIILVKQNMLGSIHRAESFLKSN